MRTIKSNRLSLVLLGIFSLTLVPSLSIAKSQEDQVLFKNRMTGRHVLSENDVGVGINFSDQEAEEAQRYWTPERIASAISLDSEQDSNAQKSVKEYLEENKINNQGNYEAVYWIGRIYLMLAVINTLAQVRQLNLIQKRSRNCCALSLLHGRRMVDSCSFCTCMGWCE